MFLFGDFDLERLYPVFQTSPKIGCRPLRWNCSRIDKNASKSLAGSLAEDTWRLAESSVSSFVLSSFLQFWAPRVIVQLLWLCCPGIDLEEGPPGPSGRRSRRGRGRGSTCLGGGVGSVSDQGCWDAGDRMSGLPGTFIRLTSTDSRGPVPGGRGSLDAGPHGGAGFGLGPHSVRGRGGRPSKHPGCVWGMGPHSQGRRGGTAVNATVRFS